MNNPLPQKQSLIASTGPHPWNVWFESFLSQPKHAQPHLWNAWKTMVEQGHLSAPDFSPFEAARARDLWIKCALTWSSKIKDMHEPLSEEMTQSLTAMAQSWWPYVCPHWSSSQFKSLSEILWEVPAPGLWSSLSRYANEAWNDEDRMNVVKESLRTGRLDGLMGDYLGEDLRGWIKKTPDTSLLWSEAWTMSSIEFLQELGLPEPSHEEEQLKILSNLWGYQSYGPRWQKSRREVNGYWAQKFPHLKDQESFFSCAHQVLTLDHQDIKSFRKAWGLKQISEHESIHLLSLARQKEPWAIKNRESDSFINQDGMDQWLSRGKKTFHVQNGVCVEMLLYLNALFRYRRNPNKDFIENLIPVDSKIVAHTLNESFLTSYEKFNFFSNMSHHLRQHSSNMKKFDHQLIVDILDVIFKDLVVDEQKTTQKGFRSHIFFGIQEIMSVYQDIEKSQSDWSPYRLCASMMSHEFQVWNRLWTTELQHLNHYIDQSTTEQLHTLKLVFEYVALKNEKGYRPQEEVLKIIDEKIKLLNLVQEHNPALNVSIKPHRL